MNQPITSVEVELAIVDESGNELGILNFENFYKFY
jgi:hypothetical protein